MKTDSSVLSVFCYGDEENARIYAMHLTTANQSEIRRAYLVSVSVMAIRKSAAARE